MSILAFRTLDCASKVRIRYFLTVPLERVLLDALEPDTLEVQEFSRWNPEASDHASLSKRGRWHATGVLGGNLLVVTFGKEGPDGRRAVEGAIDAFEARLGAVHGVDVGEGRREAS